MKDQYANYVVQKMIEVAESEAEETFTSAHSTPSACPAKVHLWETHFGQVGKVHVEEQ